MTNDKRIKLIGKQQLEIENLKSVLSIVEDKLVKIQKMFISIGSPLNDNILKMNKKQLEWCQEVYNEIREINL